MSIQILSVSLPVWANEEGTMIDCFITTNLFNGEAIPFSASPEDCEEHGRVLFSELISGVHGPIGAYIAPAQPEPTTDPAA